MHVLHALKKINLTNYLYIYRKKFVNFRRHGITFLFIVMVNIQLARPF